MAKPIRVGRECQIWDIVSALEKAPTYSRLVDKLFDIAHELGVPSERVNALQQRRVLDTHSNLSLTLEVLEEWVSRKADAATLDKLITVLGKFGLNDCCTVLTENFLANDSSEKREFVKPTRDVVDFLCSSSNSVLVLSSRDVLITCKKLTATLERCPIYDLVSFLEFCSNAGKDDKSLLAVTTKDIREVKLAVKQKGSYPKLIIVAPTAVADQLRFDMVLESTTTYLGVQIGIDKMQWAELSPAYQHSLHKSIEEMLKITIQDTDLDQVMEGQVLFDVINKKAPDLLNGTTATNLPFYLSQKLRSQILPTSSMSSGIIIIILVIALLVAIIAILMLFYKFVKWLLTDNAKYFKEFASRIKNIALVSVGKESDIPEKKDKPNFTVLLLKVIILAVIIMTRMVYSDLDQWRYLWTNSPMKTEPWQNSMNF